MKTKGNFLESEDFRNYREAINRDSIFLKGQMVFGLIVFLAVIFYSVFWN